MTLWFKVWCETRDRVIVAALALAAVSLLLVGWTPHWAHAGDAPQTIFLVLATVLGGGSLRQERALGTLGFTLALPVSRRRHVRARIAVGIAEVIALAALVAVLTRTPQVIVLWGACGVVVLLIAIAVATLVTNEYVAWLASFGAVMLYEIAINLGPHAANPHVDVYRLMTDGLVGAPLPWLALAAALALGALVTVASSLVLDRQEL